MSLKIPYLEIHNDTLFDTIYADGSQEFYLKVQPFFNSYGIIQDKINPDNKNIQNCINECLGDSPLNYIIYSNELTPPYKAYVEKLYNDINYNDELSISDKIKKSAMLNYMMSSFSFEDKFIQLDIDFSFSGNKKDSMKEYFEEYEKNTLNNIEEQGILCSTESEKKTYIIYRPTYKKATIKDIFVVLEQLKEDTILYHAIEIYGNKSYILFHDFVKEIENSGTIDKQYCSIHSEYNDVLEKYIKHKI